ncbi:MULTISPECIES: isochorismatase family cysteine hydrolase [Cytobacillus]|nr:isochorismatase family cysteine hydrolase [Cytobacillus stercorigallinarum]
MNITTEKKTALIIIDMINDFQFKHGKVLAKKALKMTTSINLIRTHFHQHKLPVIYINDHYKLWKADIEEIMAYCNNPISAPILQTIKPSSEDYFLIKPKHSAFYGTALHTLLNQLAIDKLIMVGLAGNICVLFSANDAYMREYKLHIPANCIASNDDHDNENALIMMKDVLKANIDPLP